MKMYTQIILLLFGFAAAAAHILKEPDVKPCLEETEEPIRKFTNGHGFQYIYRRRPLEIIQKRPGKIQEKADVTVPTPAETQSTPKVTVPTLAAVESTTKVIVSTTPGEESTTKVTVSAPAEAQSTTKDTVPTPATEQSTTKVTVPAVSPSKPNTDKVTATKNRRNNMFNAMRERYHSNKNKNSNSSEASRQKREINNKGIPEAPTLPELDIQSFPEYVQKMLTSRPTVENSNKTINREENSESLEEDIEKLFSDDTEIYENPRTYGMKLNNGEGYSWNHINEQNKNTYDDTQHISEPVQESIISQQANITEEKTEKENLSNIDKEIKPTAMIEKEISNKREDNDLHDRAVPVAPKENYTPNNNSIDNIKNKLNEMLANNNGSFSSPKDSKPRTYGMSLKGDTANIWNDIAGAPHVIIQTAVTSAVNKNTEYKTINDIMKPTNDDTIGKNDTDPDKGLTKKENNNKSSTLDENQILHLTTSKPTIFFATTSEPSQKVKRFTEENVGTQKEETDLRDKMEKSFMQILGKFPPFESITSKPNVIKEEEKTDREPKTYGMNLTGSHGYVWNDLANPGVRYNVGETETSNTTDHINTEPTTSPTTEENQSENFSQPSTKITETEPPSTEVTTTSKKDVTTTLSPVTTEITTESTTTESKPLTTEITSESTTESNKQITDVTSEFTTTETNPLTTENTIESTTTESNLQTTKEKPQTTEKSSASATTDQNDKENTNQEEDNKDKNPVQISLEELLKKDEFWDWMTKWTTTYLEVLKKNIKTMVKDEVEKQLKDYMNKNTENNKDSVNNKANNTEHETEKNKENEGDNKSNAKDKENCETNKLNQKTNHPSLNVTAKSIYGGAVGNDHVTNIFIFNSNGETNKTIESLLDFIHHKNPVNTSADETGSDDKDKNPDKTTNSKTYCATSNKTEPSNTTPSTKEDKHDKENNDETTADTSTTKSSTINSEGSKDSKTESNIVDKSTESSENDTTTVALNDDVTEKSVSGMNSSSVDSSTPNSTEATTVKYNNGTEKTITSTSNVIEPENDDCEETDPEESAILEINIGAKNTENNNKKCKRKDKPATGLLATLGINLKNPLKGLL